MLRLSLFTLVLFFFQQVFGQSFFGNELESGKTSGMKMSAAYLWYFGQAGENYAAIGAKGSKVIVTEYKRNLDYLDDYTLKLKYEGYRLDLEKMIAFQEDLICLTSYFNESKQLRYYFIQKYLGHGKLSTPIPLCASKWDATTEMAIDYNKNKERLLKERSIKMIVSDDENSLAVLIPKVNSNQKELPNEWDAHVFDKELEMISRTFTVPKMGVSISEFALSNSGKLIAVGVEGFRKVNDIFFPATSRSHLFKPQFLGDGYLGIIFDINTGELSSVELKGLSQDVICYKAKYLEGSFVICGFYGDVSSSSSMNTPQGYFYVNIDQSSKILVNKRTEFNSFMDPIKEKVEETKFIKEERKKDKNVLNRKTDLIIRDVLIKANGDLVILSEMLNWSETLDMSSSSTMITNYNFEYGDILAVSLDLEGKSKWMQRIFKQQQTVDDYGYYSSYCVVEKENELHFMMNDRLFYVDYEAYENQTDTERSEAKKAKVLGGATISNNGKLERYAILNSEQYSSDELAPRSAILGQNELVFFGRKTLNVTRVPAGVSSLELDQK